MPSTELTTERPGGRPGGATSAVTPTLRCLIVDDQPATLGTLARMLHAHPSVARIRTATDATGALRELRDTEVDVAFIEAGMPNMDGVELAWVLKRFLVAPAVVFVTRHPGRAADAFDLGAVDYLIKPAQPERVAETLRRVMAARGATAVADHADQTVPREPVGAVRQAPAATRGTGKARADAGDEAIPVELAGTTKLVRRSSVRWAQAWGDYVRLHTADGSHLIRARLAALADCWRAAGLVRIHRSYLVQLRFVADVLVADSGKLTVVVDGQRLPVSRRLTPTLRDGLLSAVRSATAATT
jgi:DNA-binding LytR/AlgR family response regulator